MQQVDTELLLQQSTTHEAGASKRALEGAARDSLLRRLPAKHKLLALELLAARNRCPSVTCPLCSNMLHHEAEIVDHVAEHARASLLDPQNFKGVLDDPEVVDQICQICMTMPVAAAVKLIDAACAAGMEGDDPLETARAAAERGTASPSSAAPSSAAPSSAAPSSAVPAARRTTVLPVRMTGTGRHAHKFSVAASRLGRYTEMGECDRYLHRSTVRTHTALRDVEDSADGYFLAQVDTLPPAPPPPTTRPSPYPTHIPTPPLSLTPLSPTPCH